MRLNAQNIGNSTRKTSGVKPPYHWSGASRLISHGKSMDRFKGTSVGRSMDDCWCSDRTGSMRNRFTGGTIWGLWFSAKVHGISAQYMALYGTVPRFWGPEIPTTVNFCIYHCWLIIIYNYDSLVRKEYDNMSLSENLYTRIAYFNRETDDQLLVGIARFQRIPFALSLPEFARYAEG